LKYKIGKLLNYLKLILLYFNTLKYLKKSQILFRILNFLEIRHVSKKVSFHLMDFSNNWVKLVTKNKSIIKSNYFNFLNQEHYVDINTWKTEKQDKLWEYNLHYFNFINSVDYIIIYKYKSLIKKWISANPPFYGVGWDRYPTSIRIVNWIKWILLGNELDNIELKSLFIQSRWLFKNPERHLLGNHFFSNLKALIFAGCIFNSPEAKKWFFWSLKNINVQLQEQVLSDGGHFERSPMYHALFLEDILDLINLANTFKTIDKTIVTHWENLACQMLCWLKSMIHTDKEIAFFNDASLGVANSFEDLLIYAKKLNLNIKNISHNNNNNNNKICVTHLNNSGYIRLESKKAVAILDVAPLGPDYLPAHGHADTLSFEMSVLGERVVVNGGTSCYENNNIRLKERQTSSHSTVEVNNKNSSEVWGSFRVANRAYPKNLSIKELDNQINISCSHTGYAKQGKGIWHIRNWLMKDNEIEVIDQIKGEYNTATSRVIFHPNVSITKKHNSIFDIHLLSGKRLKLKLLNGNGKIIKVKHAIEFGKVLDTKCLLIQINDSNSHYKLTW